MSVREVVRLCEYGQLQSSASSPMCLVRVVVLSLLWLCVQSKSEASAARTKLDDVVGKMKQLLQKYKDAQVCACVCR